MIAKDTVALYARVSSESHAIIQSAARSRRSGSGSLPMASSSNRITPTLMRATVVQSCFDRHWSGYAMRSLRARSHASMSMLRTGLPAVTPIKCSWSTSFAARAQRLLS